VLYGISLEYKESANCRMEAMYCHQLGVPMVPMMLSGGYKPNGWLGMLLGTRLWYGFFETAPGAEGEATFQGKMDEMCRELGAKTKAPPALKQATAPPAPAPARVATPAPAPATARARAPAQAAKPVALAEGPEAPPTGHPVPADASAAATIARLEERSSQQAVSIARLGADLAAATATIARLEICVAAGLVGVGVVFGASFAAHDKRA
jgi:hypothetical protein